MTAQVRKVGRPCSSLGKKNLRADALSRCVEQNDVTFELYDVILQQNVRLSLKVDVILLKRDVNLLNQKLHLLKRDAAFAPTVFSCARILFWSPSFHNSVSMYIVFSFLSCIIYSHYLPIIPIRT
jgi:hypothetical protein